MTNTTTSIRSFDWLTCSGCGHDVTIGRNLSVPTASLVHEDGSSICPNGKTIAGVQKYYVIDPDFSAPGRYATFAEAEAAINRSRNGAKIVPVSQIHPDYR